MIVAIIVHTANLKILGGAPVVGPERGAPDADPDGIKTLCLGGVGGELDYRGVVAGEVEVFFVGEAEDC